MLLLAQPNHESPLRRRLVDSLHAVDWLLAHGFEPRMQTASLTDRPSVMIKHHPRCRALHRKFGAEVVERRDDEHGQSIRYEVTIRGCAVAWYEPGVVPCNS
ncbi:hypothetical protein [Chitiniphilus shinanonensis]|uniref:hypothetical protein n=1 Tax=Chitiniphilus shinanonensis TaxID=553088 RepID=UPI00304DCCE6